MWIYPHKRENLPRKNVDSPWKNVDLVNLLQGKATIDVELTHHECRSFVASSIKMMVDAFKNELVPTGAAGIFAGMGISIPEVLNGSLEGFGRG